jgi:hypothetical protein
VAEFIYTMYSGQIAYQRRSAAHLLDLALWALVSDGRLRTS